MDGRSSFSELKPRPNSELTKNNQARPERLGAKTVQSVEFQNDTRFSFANSTLGTFGNGSNDSAFSIAFWIYIPDSSDFGTAYRYPFTKFSGADGEWYATTYNYNKSSQTCGLAFALWDHSASRYAQLYHTTILEVGKWSHVVCTSNGNASSAAGTANDNGIKIYLNSALIAGTFSTQTGYVAMEAGSTAVTIGAYTIGASTGFIGNIAEFALWNAELTALSIKALYTLDPQGVQGTVDDPSEFNLGEKIVDRLGKIKVHLFGSFLRNSFPTEDNSHYDLLDSDDIHEFIGAEPLLDKFDTISLQMLSGSNRDNIIAQGSWPILSHISDPHLMFRALNQSKRGRVASVASGQAGTTGSLNRFLKIYDPKRAYSDSLVPQLAYPIMTFKKTSTGGTTQNIQYNGEANKTRAMVLSNNPNSGSFKWFTSLGVNFNTRFDLDLVSNSAVVAAENNTVFSVNPALRVRPSFDSSVGAFGIPGQDYIKTYEVGFLDPVSNDDPLGGAHALAIDFSMAGESTSYHPWYGSEVHKNGIYGFGKIGYGKANIRRRDLETKHALNKIFFGISAGFNRHSGVLPLALDNNSRRWSLTELRGFRYGLMNVAPQSPHNVFRNNSFGQFADMIEQSPEGKFVARAEFAPQHDLNLEGMYSIPIEDPPVVCRFVTIERQFEAIDGIQVRIAAFPEETNSHNLSMYSTSSIPYFDNEVRDRFEPTPETQDQIDVADDQDIQLDEQ